MQIVQNKKNVCVIGMGYVGLTLAIRMADVGIKVKGMTGGFGSSAM